ncbi:hypothetical protein Hanom_Chr10g00900621 [Helianthus anomalus]
MRCDIAFYEFSPIPGIVLCLFNFQKLMSWFWYLEPGISLEATSLSFRIEVRLAYILPSPNPINSFAIDEIILGMVVVVITFFINYYLLIMYTTHNPYAYI